VVDLQYRLFGSKGTADYYLENGIDITPMEMPTDTESGSQINLKAFTRTKVQILTHLLVQKYKF
jgi:hypothetical protein